MQTMLSFSGDLFHFLGEVGLSFQKAASEPRSELIGPGSFDHDASQMRIAGFGNAGLNSTTATGVLAGNQATVAHQLPGTGEARQLADFGDDGDGADSRPHGEEPAAPSLGGSSSLEGHGSVVSGEDGDHSGTLFHSPSGP